MMTQHDLFRCTSRAFRSAARLALLAAALLPAALGAAERPPSEEAPWEGAPLAGDPRAVLAAAERDATGAGEPVVVLWSESRYTFDEAGRLTRSARFLYRVGAGADPSWSTLTERWSPWHQARPQVRARVVSPDGAVHPLDPATLSEAGEADLPDEVFGDQRVLRGPLPAVAPGAVVEQEVTVADTAPFFDRGSVETLVIGSSVPCRRALLTVDVPEAMPLRWITHLLPPGSPQEVREGGRRRLIFDYRDLPPFPELVPGLPPETPRLPTISFSTGGSWREIAARYSAIVDSRIHAADLAALRAQAAPAASQVERIDHLLGALNRQVRYTGVEFGDASIIPRTPAETLKRRYGDCKDKAALLTALLRAEEIPAFVALLRAGPGRDVEEALPGFGGFDHAIVFVPGAPAIWIDPTEPFARAGELPAGDQGRLALVAAPDTQGLLRIPEAPAAENREVQTREVSLADDGLGRMVLTTEAMGEPARVLRHLVADSPKETVRQTLEEYFRTSELSRAKKLDRFEAADPADLTRPFRLQLETRQSGRSATDRREAVVGIPLADLLTLLPAAIRNEEKEEKDKEGDGKKPAPRRADYWMSEPYVLEVHYRIAPPAGYALRELPKARTRSLGSATLAESYAALGDGTVTADLRFDSGKRRLSPEELAALHRGYRDLLEEKPVLVSFDQVGEAHLAAGRIPEALQELRRLVAAAPDRAQPHLRLARALLAGGMGTAARGEARHAVALEPRSAAAQANLGWVLEHDEIGRRFDRGFDREGALTAYRKAKQLDPTDAETRAQLAFLLEHDPQGRQFGPGADLAGALAEHRALKDQVKSAAIGDNIGIDLLWLGRPAEAREALQGTQRVPLVLATTALLEGPEAAAREAERREEGAPARLEALKGAAGVLLLLRRYAEAGALLAAAGRSSPEAASFLAEASSVARARRHEEVAISLGEPAGVAKRMLVALYVPEAAKGGLEPLLSRSLLSGSAGHPTSWSEVPAFAQEALRNLGLPMEVVLDLALAQSESKVEGDDALGYRVELKVATGKEPATWESYVVREGSEYRLAALEGFPESLGIEALRRARAKDWKGARQWLDWALPAPPAAADDPLASPVVTLLWHKGAVAGGAGEAETLCAAAALAAGVQDVAADLGHCRDAETDRLRQAALDLALVKEHQANHHPAEALAVGRRLAGAWPASETAFQLEVALLAEGSRWEEIRQAAEARLAAKADDRTGLRALWSLEMRKGDFAALDHLRERLVKAGSTEAEDLNNFAWMALLRGRVEDADLDSAQRAATSTQYRSHGVLHTLAALYAEKGKTAEAYQVILQAIGTERGRPGSADWYVFGRLAEQYGLPEVARTYYEKVEPTARDKSGPDKASTYSLAQRRLAALPPAGGKSGQRAGGSGS